MPNPSQIIRSKFPFEPTEGQKELFKALDTFLRPHAVGERPALLLSGYAGTGKTTVVSALVKVLPLFNYKFVLMAPTGRAAKVMSQYAGRVAFTVHKMIYKQTADAGSGDLQFKLQKNYHKKTIFLVDEASMLTNAQDFGKKGLLEDLMRYVYAVPDNKLIMIGDEAQLPPVGQVKSPGLDAGYLQSTFGLTLSSVRLTEVMRQAADSGILYNATHLRDELQKDPFTIQFYTKKFKDIFRMTGERLEDGLRYAYDKYGAQNTVVICRSNKQAVFYNEYIRRQIHFTESELEAGDLLMIVRNNYHFLPEDLPGGFLANGDFVEVRKVRHLEELHGFRYADLTLSLIDYPDQPTFDAKVMLDTLHSYTTSLDQEDYQKLYASVEQDYLDLPTKKQQREAIKSDPYLNALQVKFAYALTCHKAQGGQWPAVFVDQGYLTDELVDKEYLRWLYTAVTRATEELYLVNFHAKFF